MNDLSTTNFAIQTENEWSFPITTCDLLTETSGEIFDPQYVMVPSSMARCIVRTDTNQVLGVHGSKYKAIKHDDVVNSVFEAVAASGISNDYDHKVNVFDNGAKMRGTIRFNDLTIEPAVGDTIVFQLTFFNSYDGSWAFQQSAEGLRLICLNGMVSQYSVAKTWQKHTANINVKASASKLQAALDGFFQSKEQYLNWKHAHVSDQMAEDFFKHRVCRINNNTSTFKWNEKRLDDLMVCWRNDSGALGKNKWALYNALTYWSSHTEDNKSPANTQRLREGIVSKAIAKRNWEIA